MTIDIEKVKKAIEEGYIEQCPFCGSFRISRHTYECGSCGCDHTDYDCEDCGARNVPYSTEGWEEKRK